MKNTFVLFVAILLITSCTRQATVEEPVDRWNGYAKYLKTGEQVHTLFAGKTIDVGTVTYGIDDNANFYVTYDCSASGWTMSETHMFAGDKEDMPLNKPGSPKIGLFPNSTNHSPMVSTYTYTVPLSSLPPAETPGFVVATHCVVHSPSNQVETAWGEGDFTFNDKSWGWYDVYYFNQPENVYTILYGTLYTQDSLKLYHLNVTTGNVTMILKEFVGSASGTFDGTAYDDGTGMFFFVNYDTRELYVNQLADESSSFSAGTLNGTAASGTFYNNAFYYVNADFNTINMVTFTSDWLIASEVVLTTIPSSIVVNDIAMSPDGDYLYIIGEVNGGATEMVKWSVSLNTFYTMALAINDGAQIAYGNDGNLYAVAPVVEGESSSEAYIVNPNTGVLTEINEGYIIILDDEFSDLSLGPVM